MTEVRVITDEEMEQIGFALPHMSADQLRLIKNKIEQIFFERIAGGKTEFVLSLEKDESAPFGVKISLPPELQKMLDDSSAELQKALDDLNAAHRGDGDDASV